MTTRQDECLNKKIFVIYEKVIKIFASAQINQSPKNINLNFDIKYNLDKKFWLINKNVNNNQQSPKLYCQQYTLEYII